MPLIFLIVSPSTYNITHFILYVNYQTKAQSNSPSRKGGVLLRSAFARGATKGVGGQLIFLFFHLLFLWGISGQKKRIVGSEISHFRAMILLLNDYLLEENFEVVSNTSGRRFLDSTAQSPVIRTSAIS